MIDAVLIALAASGLLAIFLDTVDWKALTSKDNEELGQTPGPADDGPVIVTDIHQLIGRFDPNG